MSSRLQRVREWMELQKEFGEEWILTEHPEVLEAVEQDAQAQAAPSSGLSSKASFPAQSWLNTNANRPPVVAPQSASFPSSASSEPSAFSLPASPARQQASSQKSSSKVFLSGQALEPVEASTLEELKAKLFAFNGCALKKMATHTVFADGNPKSPLMFVGEAPGADEDLQGVPFVGASGQLLNKMLAAIHIRRPDVYITNVVNWRPPGNRPPTPDEIALCLPFLERHIALVQPKFLVLLGGTAMKAVLRRTSSLSQARGVWHLHTPVPGAEPIRTMVTFHPSYLLRSPGQKVLAWQDLQRLQEALHQEGLFLE